MSNSDFKKSVRTDRRDVFFGCLNEGLETEGYYDIPKIKGVQYEPLGAIRFSDITNRKYKNGSACVVHFYEDDYKFLRILNDPGKYLALLKKHEAVIAPDFSLYKNKHVAEKIACTYVNFKIGAWLQKCGIKVIPNVRLSGYESAAYALAGVPENSTLAIGAHGCTKNLSNRPEFVEELKMIINLKNPTNLIIYGSDAYSVLDYPRSLGIPVYLIKPNSSEPEKGGEHE